ncbi:hypothetical protein K503DRAFT_804127 [Rhizopogon vinicolor AM-OR11-026]|uniref:Uncharacterized protein n=1 Tax=Rhizopogon vinicolor AM-OR11-026 TaxID=1314800 RepID=A0A1B7MMC8_9AGAM|nr:hypothetical protein K503DRAFT_804127 [Rhizopogon vinicolor AM-OR11-026]
MSSSQLGIVEQGIGSTNDEHFYLEHAPVDQGSTRSTLQSFLGFLDRHYHHDGVNGVYKEIIRNCIAGMLASCQPEASRYGDELHSIALNELNAVHLSSTTLSLSHTLAFQQPQCQLLDQDYEPLPEASATTLREADRQLSPDLLLSHTSNPVNGRDPFWLFSQSLPTTASPRSARRPGESEVYMAGMFEDYQEG